MEPSAASETAGLVELAIGMFQLLYLPFLFLIFGACGHQIARKLNDPSPWLAWIPIANLFLFVRLAQRSPSWVIMFFLPVVFLVAWYGVFSRIASRLGLPGWIAIGMIFPVANLMVLIYLAASGVKVDCSQFGLDQPAHKRQLPARGTRFGSI